MSRSVAAARDAAAHTAPRSSALVAFAPTRAEADVWKVAVRVLFDVCGVVAHEQELALAPEFGHDIEDGLKQQQSAWARSLQVHKSIVQGQNEDQDTRSKAFPSVQYCTSRNME